MKITLQHQARTYSADLSQPLDISMPLPATGEAGVNCFYAPPFGYAPATDGGNWVGLVAQGSPVNTFDVRLNPHGNGTHTECVGHIADTPYSIHTALREFHFVCQLASIYPQKQPNGDRVITVAQLAEVVATHTTEAFVLRTLPNDAHKLRLMHSGSNPPYLEPAALAYLAACGVSHFLLDLPSVDKEQDEGKVAAHKAFWQYPEQPRLHATITELIYVPNHIADGYYLLNLQIPSFPTDAAPSKPVLYALQPSPA